MANDQEEERAQMIKQWLKVNAIAQACLAVPVLLLMGFNTFAAVVIDINIQLYYFFTNFFSFLMTAGIIFIVGMELKTTREVRRTFLFEAGKSAMATALWVWLILDAMFGPWKREAHYKDQVTGRVIRSCSSFVLLLLFFYPTLTYAYVQWKREREEDDPTRWIYLRDDEDLESRGDDDEDDRAAFVARRD